MAGSGWLGNVKTVPATVVITWPRAQAQIVAAHAKVRRMVLGFKSSSNLRLVRATLQV
jgi:hypothetical protein